jgi:hypothetical protein
MSLRTSPLQIKKFRFLGAKILRPETLSMMLKVGLTSRTTSL